VAPAVNVGALTAAGNAAAAATNAASAPRSTPRQEPSIWIVEIIGYGGQASPAAKPCASGMKNCGAPPATKRPPGGSMAIADPGDAQGGHDMFRRAKKRPGAPGRKNF
jgi:hypothetical protein